MEGWSGYLSNQLQRNSGAWRHISVVIHPLQHDMLALAVMCCHNHSKGTDAPGRQSDKPVARLFSCCGGVWMYQDVEYNEIYRNIKKKVE